MQIYSISFLCFLLLFIVTIFRPIDSLHSESGLVEGLVTKEEQTVTLSVTRQKRSSCDKFKRKSQCMRLQQCVWTNRKRKCFRCPNCNVPAGANGPQQN
ncbi:unnamed protein product [Allacma fusca]|uniref:Uncharacterized protein n=1 Tax=Allacma fusca TaxID=39272 RepID=A0A8J2L551_9HEXA|nr:unnamed protein product [Allacma fusca]